MSNTTLNRLLALSIILSLWVGIKAQSKVEKIPFGDMDQWITREIKESGVIGGKTKQVYAIGPTEKIVGNEPYENKGGSPWATSNVMARVMGVTKTNVSVFPEKRGEGYCARLDTRMESVKVLGLIDITVLAAGSLYLGKMHEPITSTKDPDKYLQMGIPFTKRPKALQYDYKVRLADQPNRIRATGFSRITDVDGKDRPIVLLLLQKRWEDEKGNVYAKRVGTMVEVYYGSTKEWINDSIQNILYGDITKTPFYVESLMKLQDTDRYTINSKGENVMVQEIGWADADETPTHLLLQFASSHGGAYIGSPGNSLWIDNIRLVYEE
ncbi:MAG: glycoside hydrolase xylanase [Bacteroidales bacterium]|nr:glycoside hydrolase xylanase [Bacteroidales bacterium]